MDSRHLPLPDTRHSPGGTVDPVPRAVADTMRRVQAQLAAGAAPSFEALLAFGEPRSA